MLKGCIVLCSKFILSQQSGLFIFGRNLIVEQGSNIRLANGEQPVDLLHGLSNAADTADRLERDFLEMKRHLESVNTVLGTTSTTQLLTDLESTAGSEVEARKENEADSEEITEETIARLKSIENFIALDLVKKVESLFQRVRI